MNIIRIQISSVDKFPYPTADGTIYKYRTRMNVDYINDEGIYRRDQFFETTTEEYPTAHELKDRLARTLYQKREYDIMQRNEQEKKKQALEKELNELL